MVVQIGGPNRSTRNFHICLYILTWNTMKPMKPSILVVHNFDIFWFMTHLSKLFKITETAWNNFEQVVLKWGKAWAARIASAVLQERHGEGSGAREGPFEDTGDTWRYHTTSIHIHPHPDHPDHRTWCHMIEHGGKHGGGYNMIFFPSRLKVALSCGLCSEFHWGSLSLRSPFPAPRCNP